MDQSHPTEPPEAWRAGAALDTHPEYCRHRHERAGPAACRSWSPSPCTLNYPHPTRSQALSRLPGRPRQGFRAYHCQNRSLRILRPDIRLPSSRPLPIRSEPPPPQVPRHVLRAGSSQAGHSFHPVWCLVSDGRYQDHDELASVLTRPIRPWGQPLRKHRHSRQESRQWQRSWCGRRITT